MSSNPTSQMVVNWALPVVSMLMEEKSLICGVAIRTKIKPEFGKKTLWSAFIPLANRWLLSVPYKWLTPAN